MRGKSYLGGVQDLGSWQKLYAYELNSMKQPKRKFPFLPDYYRTNLARIIYERGTPSANGLCDVPWPLGVRVIGNQLEESIANVGDVCERTNRERAREERVESFKATLATPRGFVILTQNRRDRLPALKRRHIARACRAMRREGPLKRPHPDRSIDHVAK